RRFERPDREERRRRHAADQRPRRDDEEDAQRVPMIFVAAALLVASASSGANDTTTATTTTTTSPASIAVLDFVPARSEEAALAKIASSAFVEAIAKRAKGARVIGMNELKGVVDAQAQARLA